MYPHTAAFDTEITRSHQVATRCDVMQSNIVQTTLTLTDGTITVQDDPIHRRCNVRLQDATGALVPSDFRDLLTPGVGELKLWRGVAYADGTSELLPLGVFGISRYRLDDSGPTMSVQIDGFDRARRVQRAVLNQDYVINKNTNYVTAVQGLVSNRYPSVKWGDIAATTLLTPLIVLQAGKDPWGEARRLLGNIGYEIFFDADGNCTIRVVDAPHQHPADWSLIEGANATLLSLTKTLSDEAFFNHAVVVGESTSTTQGPIPRWEVADTNPSSPTSTTGPMGDVVDYYTSSDITSNQQASQVAKARLNKSLGIPINVETQDLVHPGLDVDDLLQVTRVRSDINDIYVASKISIPMVHDRSMNVATRQRLLGV